MSGESAFGPYRIGLDWGKFTNHVCVLGIEDGARKERSFDNRSAGTTELIRWLVGVTGLEPAALPIGIERRDGPLAERLCDSGFPMFFLTPKQLDRFRDRLVPSGAKDDRRDPRVMASALRTDPEAFSRIHAPDPEMRVLRELARERAGRAKGLRMLGQRIRQRLSDYWPELERVLRPGEATHPWVAELFGLAPTPEKAARVRVSTYDRVLRGHGIRRIAGAGLKKALTAGVVPVSPGATTAAVAVLRRQFREAQAQVALLKEAEADLAVALEKLAKRPGPALPGRPADAPSVVEQVRSMPGMGEITTATLLGEAGHLVEAGNYRGLRALCGVAPVTVASGRSVQVRQRRAARGALREAMFHGMRTAVQKEPYRAAYQARRARGDSWGTALRKAGDQHLRMLVGMVHNGTLYDPQRAAGKAAA